MLVPLVCSLVFGMMTATVLLLMVLPAAYSILEDFGFTERETLSDDLSDGPCHQSYRLIKREQEC